MLQLSLAGLILCPALLFVIYKYFRLKLSKSALQIICSLLIAANLGSALFVFAKSDQSNAYVSSIFIPGHSITKTVIEEPDNGGKQYETEKEFFVPTNESLSKAVTAIQWGLIALIFLAPYLSLRLYVTLLPNKEKRIHKYL